MLEMLFKLMKLCGFNGEQALGFFRPSVHGCEYEGPHCGVYVVADHGAYMDVGEILSTGEYNVTSAHLPVAYGTPTAIAVFNTNTGTFYLQTEPATEDEGVQTYNLVACTLPGGTLTSAAIDPGYRVLALAFDPQRDTLVGVFEALPAAANSSADTRALPPTSSHMGVLYAGTIAPNGTITTADQALVPSDPTAHLLPGVAAWDGAHLNVLFGAAAGAGTVYEVASADPWTGRVRLSGALQQQHATMQITGLSFV